MDDVVICEHLWHTYPQGQVVALRDINLSITRGEVVGVIGQNGSGKTTLVKHFNGLLKPTQGKALVNGVDTAVAGVHRLSRHVGYVFQNPNHQLFARTVEAELAFGPENQGLLPEEVNARVEHTLEFFDIAPLRTMNPYRLSFPVRKLVATAAVYAMAPEILVLDEPTTGQDHRGAALMRRLIEKMRDVGATVIIVSHDMILISEVADRLVVMWNAEVIGDGTPRDVFLRHELMERTYLHAPQITQLAQRIHRPGLPGDALHVDELAGPLAAMLKP